MNSPLSGLLRGNGRWGLIRYAIMVGIYKIVENWALGWFQQKFLEPNAHLAWRVFIEYLPILTWLLAATGLVLVGRTLTLSFEQRTQSEVSRASIPEVASPPTPNEAVIQPGFEFYPGRIKLPEHRQLRAQLEAARDEVLISWNTGALAARGHMLRIPVRKRILLPHPEHVVPLLAEAESASRETIAAQIEELTRVAWQTARDEHLAIEVRWLMKAPRNTVILGDPDRRQAWGLLELFQPGVAEDLRPICWFTRERFELLYGWLHVAFNKQWERESVDPLWKPSHELAGRQILFNFNVRRTVPMVAVRLTITAPHGETYSVEDSRFPGEFREETHVWFGYPQHFQGAPAPVSDKYYARWEVKEQTSWRDAIAETYEICV